MRLFPLFQQTVSNRMQKFFAKRAPRRDDVTLNLRNVYIFFSREGLLYAVLLVITFITGVNYGNNLVLGLCFYLVSIWVISLHLTFAHIAGLRLVLRDSQLTEAGEMAWVTFDVTNDKSQPSRQLNLKFDDLPINDKDKLPQLVSETIDKQLTLLTTVDEKSKDEKSEVNQDDSLQRNTVVTSLQGTQTLTLPVKTVQRGRMQLPRLIISTVYPLGIMRAWSYAYFNTPVWVYPKPLPFDWQEANTAFTDEDNDWSVHVGQGQNDFESLDEYKAGESLARVSWAHMARGQGMLTKNFADAKGNKLRLDYSDMPATHHEEKLSQLAYAVFMVAQTGDAFTLVLPEAYNSVTDNTQIVGQGDAFVQACLLRLAKAP